MIVLFLNSLNFTKTTNKMNNQITTLPQKTKATILLENTWGMPIVRHVWLYAYGLNRKPYSYKKQLVVHFTYKGKRKKIGRLFEKAIIGKGWQDVNGAFNSQGNNVCTSFDNAQFSILSQQIKDVITSNTPKELVC